MDLSKTNNNSETTFPLKAIGQRQDIIPKHIIKWTYRKGTGNHPKSGDIISCNVGIYLIDGTEICQKSSSVVKFLFGRGVLIQGLQIVFSRCQKDEIFKVKISSQYAYEDRQDINGIPPFSTLIFDITVLDIVKPKLDSYNLMEIAQQIRHLIEKSDDEFRKQNPQKAIEILENAFAISHAFKYMRSPIGQKIVAKMVNIKLNQRQTDEALKIIEKYNDQADEIQFILTRYKIRIYEQNNQLSKLMEEMEKKYMKYHSNQNAKKVMTYYFEKTLSLDRLKQLQEEIKKNQILFLENDSMNHSFSAFGMKGFFY